MKLIRIVPSSNPDKTYDAIFELDSGKIKKISFGARGAETFLTTRDEARKAAYLARHRVRENWMKPDNAGSLSRWISWNLPTFTASVADFRRRFNV
jgi:hypothetical protein